MSQRVITVPEARAIDNYVISSGIYDEAMLIEQVARGVYHYLVDADLLTSDSRDITLLIGTGNNGGDGLSLARLLYAHGVPLRLVYTGAPKKESVNHALRTMIAGLNIQSLGLDDSDALTSCLDQSSCIIDACIGIGNNRPLAGTYAWLIEQANSSNAVRIAIDVPTGIFEGVDRTSTVFSAHTTLSIGHRKTILYLPEARTYCGEIEDIWTPFLSPGRIRNIKVEPSGLGSIGQKDTEGYEQSRSKRKKSFFDTTQGQEKYTLFSCSDLPELVISPGKKSHKHSRGSVLICAGSQDMPGAAHLCSGAATLSFAGVVYLLKDEIGSSEDGDLRVETPWQQILLSLHPSILLTEDIKRPYSAIVVGPGWKTEKTSLFSRIIREDQPIVLDADAFWYCKNEIDTMSARSAPTILTPHPKECARLLDIGVEEVLKNPVRSGQELSERYNAIVVVKGHVTHIVDHDQIAIIDGLCPALACAGSGDVLAGIIAGCLATQDDAYRAVIAGTLAHLKIGKEFQSQGIFPSADWFLKRIPFVFSPEIVECCSC